jgi:AcrR family transcriptional regulator
MTEELNHSSPDRKVDSQRGDKKARENAILDAAEQLFSRKDYHDATLDEIAQAAGLSKGTIYLYFENKIDVFLSTVERKLWQMGEIIRKAVADCDDAVAAIKRLIADELKFFNDNAEFFKVLCAQRTNIQLRVEISDDKIHERIMPIMFNNVNTVAECIQRGQKAGLFQQVNPKETAFMLSSLIHTCVFLQIIEADESKNLLDKAELVSKIFLEGLLVREC